MTEEDKVKRRAYLRNWYYNLPEVKREYGRKRYHTLIKVLQASYKSVIVVGDGAP